MKRLKQVSLCALLGLAIITFSRCEGPTPQPPETGAEVNQKILVGAAWNLQSVTVNGVDQTPLYAGLKITFTSSGFSTVEGGAVWPATGTWSFTNDDGTTIRRNDNLDVAITEISQNKLVLSLSWSKTTLGSGRNQSLAGQHVYTMTR